jgi:hypothetical protein
MQTQFLLFPLEKEFDIDEKLAQLEEKYHNLRKSQHARISGLNKDVKDLKAELEFLKGKICKEDLFL